MPIAAATYHQYVITRDAASKQLSGYVDGLPAFSVIDSAGRGVISAANVLRFFRDNESCGASDVPYMGWKPQAPSSEHAARTVTASTGRSHGWSPCSPPARALGKTGGDDQ